MSEKIRRLTAAGLVVVIFAAGVLTGIAAYRLLSPCPHPPSDPKSFMPPPPPRPHELVMIFKDRLGLDDAQVKKVEKILSEGHKEVEAIKSKVRPELERSFKKGQNKIRMILRENQVQLFNKMVEEWKHMRHKHRRGHGGHHPLPPN